MVIAKSEHAYSVLKNAFRHRTVDKTYHALVQGHPDPLQGTIDAPIGRHPKHDYKFAVMRRRQGTASPTTRRSRRTASRACSRCTSRPAAPTRSGCTWRRCKHPCVGDLTYGADPALADAGRARRGSGCTPYASASSTPTSGEYVEYESDYPDDLQHALDTLRDAV